MRFKIIFANGETEEREMSDCETVEAAHNAIAGSADGVEVAVVEVVPTEAPAQA